MEDIEMVKTITLCSSCNSKIDIEGAPNQEIEKKCPKCNNNIKISLNDEDLEELEFYPVSEPYEYVKIVKNLESLDKYYWVIQPPLKHDESKLLDYIKKALMESLDIRLDQVEGDAEKFLAKEVDKLLKEHEISIDDNLKDKFLYYINRKFIGFGKIDPLMGDPYIEDISCDGPDVPVFLYHREYGSLKSNVKFANEHELSSFVIKLSQKCGKHISIAKPMLDATMPDGSRIQMTLSSEITTKGSTFTIRKFRSDPITPTDLIEYNSMSPELIAYIWMAVEHGVNALIAGGTASGKTSVLNAIALFIPRESKIVSIEETREINLSHSNWIPGVSRSGFGEIVGDRLTGEIDLFDLMKAALRQRPEYILVGEIRGKEAYVLFQAMATGHTTYSTVHADSTKSLIHRLEGKPINVPRPMLQSLDIVLLQTNTKRKDKNVRRCKQIVEIVDIDPQTNEVLTNEVFQWDPVDDKFVYLGKSYVLERIRLQSDMSKTEMRKEMERRVELLKWMHKSNIRKFKDFAKIIFSYTENPDQFIRSIRENPIYNLEKKEPIPIKKEIIAEVEKIDNKINNLRKINDRDDDYDDLNSGKVKKFHGFFSKIKKNKKEG